MDFENEYKFEKHKLVTCKNHYRWILLNRSISIKTVICFHKVIASITISQRFNTKNAENMN